MILFSEGQLKKVWVGGEVGLCSVLLSRTLKLQIIKKC